MKLGKWESVEREGGLASGKESHFDPASHNVKNLATILRSDCAELKYNGYMFGKII